MKKLTLSAVAMTLALTAGAALAKGDDWKKEFSDADTNQDEKLSMSEWEAYGNEMFKEIDTNSDQQISMKEKEDYKNKKHDDMDKENM